MQKASRKRALLSWRPTWTSQIEGWAAKQIKANMWRFDRAEDFDDLMQDARLLFFVLGKKYPIVNEQAHFFALFRTSLSRMFIDKSRIKQKSVIDQNTCADEIVEDLQLHGTPNYGFVNLLLDEMPDELKIVLRGLTTGRVRLKLDRPAKKLRHRENHNMRLKRRFSLTSEDPVGDLRNYFVNI